MGRCPCRRSCRRKVLVSASWNEIEQESVWVATVSPVRLAGCKLGVTGTLRREARRGCVQAQGAGQLGRLCPTAAT